MQADLAQILGQHRFERILKDHSLALFVFSHIGQIVVTHHHILGRPHHRRTVSRREDINRSHHKSMRLSLSFYTQRKMHRHLVAVEVCIKTSTGQWMKHYRVTFDQNRLKRLDAHPVKSRRSVKQHRMLMDNFFENIPDMVVAPFNHSLGAFDSISQTVLFELANNKGLIKLQGYLLWQSTLMKF